ncbi:MAG TPA: hypothetical protein VGZ71_13765, partial [Puia sp.]|nr:hypothetical protein [Puia sp.]
LFFWVIPVGIAAGKKSPVRGFECLWQAERVLPKKIFPVIPSSSRNDDKTGNKPYVAKAGGDSYRNF